MRALRPALARVDAERAHMAAVRAASVGAPLLWRTPGLRVDDPRLRQQVWGMTFPNPVGLGAGYDKWARAIAAWPAVGFGFAEIGTVTPGPQEGNPRPRLFRLPDDDALINRMGFNNDGAEATAERLAQAAVDGSLHRIPVGINIGKHKDTDAEAAADDYAAALEPLWTHAAYIVVNVSSPNTPGLRDLQESSHLAGILSRVVELNQRRARDQSARPRPVLVKIAPELDGPQTDAVVDLVRAVAADGVIVHNTTLSREGLRSPAHLVNEQGGLSGRPLAARSTEMLQRVVERDPGLPVISVGGVWDSDDLYERLRRGARLVQVWTALVYRGPGLVGALNRGLLRRMDQEGIATVADLAPASVRDAIASAPPPGC